MREASLLMSDELSCDTNNRGINEKWRNTLCKKKIPLLGLTLYRNSPQV